MTRDFLGAHSRSLPRYGLALALGLHDAACVVEAGVAIKEPMELARHIGPRVALKTYPRVGVQSLGRLPDPMPTPGTSASDEAERRQAAGTEGDAVGPEYRCPQ